LKGYLKLIDGQKLYFRWLVFSQKRFYAEIISRKDSFMASIKVMNRKSMSFKSFNQEYFNKKRGVIKRNSSFAFKNYTLLLRKQRRILESLYQRSKYSISEYKIKFFRWGNGSSFENFTVLERFVWELIKRENGKDEKRNFHIVIEYPKVDAPQCLPEFELNLESFYDNVEPIFDELIKNNKISCSYIPLSDFNTNTTFSMLVGLISQYDAQIDPSLKELEDNFPYPANSKTFLRFLQLYDKLGECRKTKRYLYFCMLDFIYTGDIHIDPEMYLTEEEFNTSHYIRPRNYWNDPKDHRYNLKFNLLDRRLTDDTVKEILNSGNFGSYPYPLLFITDLNPFYKLTHLLTVTMFEILRRYEKKITFSYTSYDIDPHLKVKQKNKKV